MDLLKIKSLIDFSASSDLEELEFEEAGCRLRLSRRHGPGANEHFISKSVTQNIQSTESTIPVATGSSPPEQSESRIHFIRAPMFGIFSRSPSPLDAPFVEVGDVVACGQKLALLEAMKIFNSVDADVSGAVLEVLAEDGDEVDAGQPIFRIELDA